MAAEFQPLATVAQTALSSYLAGHQDGQAWALIDNLNADDLREMLKAAMPMLRQANGIIGLASVALDGMTPRQQRFAARDAALGLAGPYLDALAERFSHVGGSALSGSRRTS